MKQHTVFAVAAIVVGLSLALSPHAHLPNTITIISGDAQVVASGQTLADPIVAQLKDSSGNPLSGVKVTVTAEKGGAFLVPDHADGTINTEAGGGLNTSDDIMLATDAKLQDPIDLSTDADGHVYIADRGGVNPPDGRIRKVDAGTQLITTVTGGGIASYLNEGDTASQIKDLIPRSVEIGKSVGDLYFVDEHSARVFRVDLFNDQIFLVAGGGNNPDDDDILATLAELPAPVDATEDYDGNVYIAVDTTTIRKVDATTAKISTVHTFTEGEQIAALEVHRDGKQLVVADSSATSGFLLLDPATGDTTEFDVGASLGTTVDVQGNMYFSLPDTDEVRVLGDGAIPPNSGFILAGSGVEGDEGDGGPSTEAKMNTPSGVAIDPQGNLHIADRVNDKIKKVTFARVEVGEITLYTDSSGYVTTFPIRLLPSGGNTVDFTFMEVVNCATAVAAATLMDAPGGPASTPDSEQTEREPNNDEKTKFPRWMPVAGVLRPNAPGFDTIGASSGEVSHDRIVVDSHNIVHIVGDSWTLGAPYAKLAGEQIWYLTNRWETRKANGFSPEYQVSSTSGNQVAFSPAVAVGPDDALHVVWVQNLLSLGEASIYYRKLSQDPADPKWDTTPTVLLTGTTDINYDSPHVAVDKNGVVHICARKVDRTDSDHTWHVLHSTDLGTFQEIQQVSGGWELREVQIAVGPDDTTAHLAWVETPPGATPPPDELLKHKGAGGPATVYTAPIGGIMFYDLEVDSEDTPHFAIQEIRDFLASTSDIFYQKGTGGAAEKVNLNSDGFIDTLTHSHGVHLKVDSREQPHVMWSMLGSVGAGGSGKPGPRPCYALKMTATTNTWGRQEPIEEDLVNTNSVRVFGYVRSMAMSKTDIVHLVLGSDRQENKHDEADETIHSPDGYTRMYEPNLGEQDGFLLVPFGPGAAANMGCGNMFLGLSIFSTRGCGFATDFSLLYNSHAPDKSVISPGWMHNYHLTITDHSGSGLIRYLHNQSPTPDEQVTVVKPFLTLQLGDGRYIVFENREEGDLYVADPEYGYFSKIERAPTAISQPPTQYVMTTKFGIKYTFNGNGKLIEIRDTQLTANTMGFT